MGIRVNACSGCQEVKFILTYYETDALPTELTEPYGYLRMNPSVSFSTKFLVWNCSFFTAARNSGASPIKILLLITFELGQKLSTPTKGLRWLFIYYYRYNLY